MHMFELNLIKTIEDNETCEIEKEIERVKCKENINKLEVKNDEKESDLKDNTKDFAAFKKESKMPHKELEEQVHEQENKLRKKERNNKGLTEHLSHKEM